MLTLMAFFLILNSFFPLVCSTECRLLFSVLCKNTRGTVCCHQRRSGFVRMLVADTEPQVRTRSYKRPRSMQEECEGTIWLPVDSELRPLPLMLSKNMPWLMRGEIMREGHKTVAEVKNSAAQKKVQLTSDHNKLGFFVCFCCLDLFLNFTLTPIFFSYQAHLECRKAVIVVYGFTS